MPEKHIDELIALMPDMNRQEKDLLGEVLVQIFACAVPQARRNFNRHMPGFMIPFRLMQRLERIFRNDGLHWSLAFHTHGSTGGDHWGIEGE